MNEALSNAIKEAYAMAPSNVVELETFEFAHPDADTIYLVKARQDWTLTVPGVGDVLFEGAAFRFALPASGENGLQELSIAIDNVNRRVSQWIDAVKESIDPVTVTYRVYLDTDTSTPQNDPPLVLTLRGVSMAKGTATGRASFADIINKPFPHPSETYSRARFLGLGNL